MKPGKELDALVAKALGWRQLSHRLWHDENDRERWIDNREGAWSPSTDIAAAWKVVEKMIDIGYSVSVDYVEGWRCFMTQGGFGKSPVEATSAPLAICLAALKAMGVKNETEQGT